MDPGTPRRALARAIERVNTQVTAAQGVARLSERAALGLAEQATERAVEAAAERAAERATERALEHGAERAAERALERGAESVLERAAERAAEATAERALERGAERALERATERAVEATAERALEHGAERALEHAAERAAEASLEHLGETAGKVLLERGAHIGAEKVGERMVERGSESVGERLLEETVRSSLGNATATATAAGAAAAPPAAWVAHASALFQVFRVLVPVAGTLMVAHMAHADWHRATHEWARGRRRLSACLFGVSAFLDVVDVLVHVLVLASLTSLVHVDHGVLHDAERVGLYAACGAVCTMISGEVVCLRRGRAAPAKAKVD